MRYSPRLLLGGLTAVVLAACGPPKNDTNATGGTGSETGAVSGNPTTADTALTGVADTGVATDSTRVTKDSISR